MERAWHVIYATLLDKDGVVQPIPFVAAFTFALLVLMESCG